MAPEMLEAVRRIRNAAMELECACEALEDVDRHGLSDRSRARRMERVAAAKRDMERACEALPSVSREEDQ